MLIIVATMKIQAAMSNEQAEMNKQSQMNKQKRTFREECWDNIQMNWLSEVIKVNSLLVNGELWKLSHTCLGPIQRFSAS